MKKIDKKLIKQIASFPHLFLFLDYDGTLTPIASGPSKAELNAPMRRMLRELKTLKGVRVAIVSGRSLTNLKKYVRIPGLIYAGDHGFEIQGHGISYVHPAALTLQHSFQKMARQLKKALAPIREILVERKTFSISVHYRQVRSPVKIQQAKRTFLETLKSLRHTPLMLTEGKKVWEIRPTDQWHKGKAVLWMMRRVGQSKKWPVFPIYVGDDTTDEDAFLAVRKKGVGIKVIFGSARHSYAKYYVRSSAEVANFLRVLITFRRKGNLSNGK